MQRLTVFQVQHFFPTPKLIAKESECVHLQNIELETKNPKEEQK